MNTAKNIAASVRQKLLNRARSDKRPFAEFLQYYAMERFLYRLSQSAHSKHFILNDQAIYDHLAGKKIVGLYPLLPDNTCHLLAVDFDKDGWQDAVKAM